MSRSAHPVDIAVASVVVVATLVSIVCFFKLGPPKTPRLNTVTLMFCSQDDGSDAVATAEQVCADLGHRCEAQCTDGHTLTMKVTK